MEFKKKTIIWEDNNEPPKDYIWIKSDGKAYEYSYSQRKWIESKLIKTEESGGSDGGEGGGSSEVDYEAVYQFYKKKIIELLPEETVQKAILPEHYADIELGGGNVPEYENKVGFWYTDSSEYDLSTLDRELFCEINNTFRISKRIYFGVFKFTGNQEAV
jgi:hypothetical protein